MSHHCASIRVKTVAASVRPVRAKWPLCCRVIAIYLAPLAGQAVAQTYSGVDLYTLSQSPNHAGYADSGQVVDGEAGIGGNGQS
jgi:hypothetical protein